MPQAIDHTIDCLPGNADDFIYLAKIQAAFQLDEDALAKLIRNIPSFLPAEWLSPCGIPPISQDIEAISGPFLFWSGEAASSHARNVAASAAEHYTPTRGNLKRALRSSLAHLQLLHFAACQAKGWDGAKLFQVWEQLLITPPFSQFLNPSIASLQSTVLDSLKGVLGNIVEATARWCFMALSLINRTQAVLWLHENGYPFYYDIQGLTRHVFEKTVASSSSAPADESILSKKSI